MHRQLAGLDALVGDGISEQGLGQLGPLGPGDPPIDQWQLDVAERGQAGQEMDGLKHKGHPTAA
jgi:hypothetical protein